MHPPISTTGWQTRCVIPPVHPTPTSTLFTTIATAATTHAIPALTLEPIPASAATHPTLTEIWSLEPVSALLATTMLAMPSVQYATIAVSPVLQAQPAAARLVSQAEVYSAQPVHVHQAPSTTELQHAWHVITAV